VPAPAMLGRLLARLPAVARTAEQIPAYAAAWEAASAQDRDRTGPLWVVLGDSAAHGVGAPAYDRGYVGQVRRRLEERDRVPWRVVNLARSGARTAEVVDVQLPKLAREELRPDLVTAIVGGNDAVHTPSAMWLADVERLVAALPRGLRLGTVVGTVARGFREGKVRPVNARVRELAAADGLLLADLWATTGPPWGGKYADGFHPNERGYREWADALYAALALTPREPPAR
jgi:lysophospholipase L1-like esterase